MIDGASLDMRALQQPAPGTRARPALGALAALVSPDDGAALAAVALAPRALRAGTELVREGDDADHLHLLLDGWACRYKTTRDGGRQIVGLALPGDVANTGSLLFDRLDVGIRALTAATAVSVPRDRLLALAAERPGIARALTWTALVENAVHGEWALSVGRHPADRRIVRLLCEAAARLGATGHGAFRFDLPLTQDQLADALGLTAVHVNRMMQRLRGDDLIVTSGRSVVIPDLARLHAAGDFDPAYLHLGGQGRPRALPVAVPVPRHDPAGGGAAMLAGVAGPSLRHRAAPDYPLLLSETNHRCANDLQLVVSLLSLQSRRVTSQEAREALADATARVAVLARARAQLNREHQPRLDTALRQVCEGLHAQAEPRGILVSMVVEADAHGLSQAQTATLGLAVNELATNAIKHAFADGADGHVTIAVSRGGGGELVVTVEDDGLPFPDPAPDRTGLGLELVKRLVASTGGLLVAPQGRAKRFEIRVPAAA